MDINLKRKIARKFRFFGICLNEIIALKNYFRLKEIEKSG